MQTHFSVVLSVQPTGFEAVAFAGEFETGLAAIAGLGYDGVELALRDPAMVDQEALLAMARESGLVIPAIGTGQAWAEERLSFTDPNKGVRREAIDRMKSHFSMAKAAGAVVIVGLVRGTTTQPADRHQAMDRLTKALRECCDEASAAGVRLALEPINRYETTLVNTVAEGLELIDGVGAENLGLLLDTFHMNIEEPSMGESIRQAGDRIFHFHVADSNRWHPGAGHIDFRDILTTLCKQGYRGYVSGEFLPVPDAQTAAANAINCLREAAGVETG